jgi:transcriptional regulator with XRE-family HTH domain
MSAELFIAFNVTFGKLVRLERVRRGWRQADLAEKAGVTQSEVSALERRLYVAPAVRHRILRALGLSIEESER